MSKIGVVIDGHTYEVEVNALHRRDTEFTVKVNGEPVHISVPALVPPEQMDWILVDGRSYEINLDHDLRWVKSYLGMHRLEVRDLEVGAARVASGDGRIKAPVPGLIIRVLVEQGAKVEVGQPVLVLEAMKMENEIVAPRSGTVTHVNITPGQTVMLGQMLVEIS